MRLVAAVLFISWLGCLPPPQPAENVGPSGPPTPSGPDTGASSDTQVADNPASDDTGTEDSGGAPPPLQCHAIAFDTHGQVRISANEVAVDTLFTAESVTIELWAWFSNETRDGTWLLAGMDGSQTWRIGIELGELVLRASVYSLSVPLPENGWNHIAGVINGDTGELSVYINGVFSGGTDWSPPMVSSTTNPSILLGAWHTEGGSWPSAIDEVRFAQSVMHEGMSIDTSPGRPMDAWLGVWRFDENLQNTVSGSESVGTDFWFTDSCP